MTIAVVSGSVGTAFFTMSAFKTLDKLTHLMK